MDQRREIQEILRGEVAKLRDAPFEALLKYVVPVTWTVTTDSGGSYQVEVTAFWDDKKSRHLRVIVAVDDFGWRAFIPETASFIVAADGTFVGEEG